MIEHNTTSNNNLMMKRPSLLRSPPSIQVTNIVAHGHHSTTQQLDESSLKKGHHSSSRPCLQLQKKVSFNKEIMSRTQNKLMLQRQSFLADDKNYLDHPDNMRRLTKELDRVNKEYKSLKQFQDPFTLSLKRVIIQQQQQFSNNGLLATNHHHHHHHHHHHQQQQHSSLSSSVASSWSSSNSNSSLLFLYYNNATAAAAAAAAAVAQPLTANKLTRRSSSHTVHEYLMNFQEERRHSYSHQLQNNNSSGLISRIFGTSTTVLTNPVQPQQHQPSPPTLQPSQLPQLSPLPLQPSPRLNLNTATTSHMSRS